MDGIKLIRLYAVLIKLHPEAEAELAGSIHAITTTAMKRGSQADAERYARSATQQATAALVAKYFYPAMLKASNATVYRYIEYSSEVLAALKTRPASCLAFAAESYLDIAELPPGALARMSNIKADILESAASDPAPLIIMTTDEMGATLRGIYQSQGVPLQELVDLSGFQRMAPPDGCRVASDFNDALTELGEERGSRVLKSLIATAK
jgi:hypothetical protein